MLPDLCALVRRDHDDLDRALVAMLEMGTPTDELTALLEVFQLALTVHTGAELNVFATLLHAIPQPDALSFLAAQARKEHLAQQRAADALAATAPGSAAWHGCALELRVLVLDHAERAELLRWSINDHVPVRFHRALAGGYATERLRLFGLVSQASDLRPQTSGKKKIGAVRLRPEA